ncbi:hypothetical protein BJ322DRAFT_1037371 [Thelephora terrestris]|uniref:Uncharacterized protein n=1 Tax=Thelephora terrestris TaxID=56493 RepID=A0A9P6LBD8_9AGAM|nr:hypothetical protein BJ322DRAFT_1037371 [Thelephora terrestris]
MSSLNTHTGNDRPSATPITRTSSSATAVSLSVKNGFGELVEKLATVNGDIEKLDSEEKGQVLDIGELRQDISTLQAEVEHTKLAQNNRIDEILDEVKNDTKDEIAKRLEGDIGAIITESVAEQVKQQVETWARKFDAPKFVAKLERGLERNNGLLERGITQLENSRSRHANSTFDIYDDFTMPLGPIKRKDGGVSDLFPGSLRDLFSYDAITLRQLLEEYHLHPLREPADNLNRFLIFIGSRSLIQG